MIIDSHVHVLPDTVRQDLTAVRESDDWFAACHPEGAATASIESLIEAMDADGVEKSVCFTWPFAGMDLCREANDYLAAGIRRHPERLIGFGIVNPAAPDAAGEVRRCASLGLAGIGELNADAQGWTFDGEDIALAMDAIAECGLIVNLHVSEALGRDFPGRGTAWPGRLLQWAERFPDVQTVAAHMGGGLPFFTGVPGVGDVTRKLWFDTAAFPFLYKPSAMRSAMDHVPVDRFLYGSDFPLLQLPRYQKHFASAGLTPPELDALMGGNASGLFGLG
jgi:predicted TIM-barrel fold metal-dependent hydrolase